MVALLLSALVLSQASDWSDLSKVDGIAVARREVKGSSLYEYRAQAVTSASVDALCAAVFDWATVGKDHEGLILRKLLKDGPDERIIYDQMDQPLVSKRDYTMVARRSRGEGACHLRFESTTELAPKLPEGFVRMGALRGAWDFVPEAGQTKVTYTIFADPAGSVPAFLVNGASKDRTAQTLRVALQKATRAP